MPNLESWKKRYTVRDFDTKKIPSVDQIRHITNCLNFLPIQQTDENKNLPNHLVLTLTPADKSLKRFLVENWFHDPEKIEHFTTLYEAPYLFLLTDILKYNNIRKKYNSVETTSKFMMHLGLTTGVIISQSIEIGLDVCQIACTSSDDQINQHIISLLNQRFKRQLNILKRVHKTNLKIGELRLGIGVGFGMPLSTVGKQEMHEELGVKYFPAKKLNKKQPFMYIDV
jgi:hypothetical protein